MNEPSKTQLEIMLLIRGGIKSPLQIQKARGKRTSCGISITLQYLRRNGWVTQAQPNRHRVLSLTPLGIEACKNYYLLNKIGGGVEVYQWVRSYENLAAS